MVSHTHWIAMGVSTAAVAVFWSYVSYASESHWGVKLAALFVIILASAMWVRIKYR